MRYIVPMICMAMLLSGCSNSGEWSAPTNPVFALKAQITVQVPELAQSNNSLPSFYVDGAGVDFYQYKIAVKESECGSSQGYSPLQPARMVFKADLTTHPDGPVVLCAFATAKDGRTQEGRSFYKWFKIADPIVNIQQAVASRGSELLFMIYLTSPSDFDTIIEYLTVDNTIVPNLTAHGGTDFVATSGTLVIPAKSLSGFVKVQTVGSSAAEVRQMGLKIIDAEGAFISQQIGIGSILALP